MSKRIRNKLARQNNAQPKGPAPAEANVESAVESTADAQKLALFLPPHAAVLCNEDRHAYHVLLQELIEIYQPKNQIAAAIVTGIANARWQVERLNHCLTMQWNLAVVDSANTPSALAPELAEIESMARSSKALYSGDAIAHRLNRQIDQLELRIARFERRLKFVHANYPHVAIGRTQPASRQPVENAQPPVFVTENTPEVIRAYEQQFPNREIVVLPADNVAKGIDIEDDMPVAPRKVA
ncbi:MAG: hypothetical protein ACKV2U_33475 [Bryobacteraceae bacterium]